MELQLQAIQSSAWVMVGTAIAVGLVMQPAVGTALGEGYAAGKALEAIARQPEAQSGITSTMLVGIACTETSAIYGVLLSFIMFFVNPFFNDFLKYLATMGL